MEAKFTWLAWTNERTEADTRALELERPALAGTLPHTAARIPLGTFSFGITSRAPCIPHKKYLYQIGPVSASLIQALKRSINIFECY